MVQEQAGVDGVEAVESNPLCIVPVHLTGFRDHALRDQVTHERAGEQVDGVVLVKGLTNRGGDSAAEVVEEVEQLLLLIDRHAEVHLRGDAEITREQFESLAPEHERFVADSLQAYRESVFQAGVLPLGGHLHEPIAGQLKTLAAVLAVHDPQQLVRTELDAVLSAGAGLGENLRELGANGADQRSPSVVGLRGQVREHFEHFVGHLLAVAFDILRGVVHERREVESGHARGVIHVQRALRHVAGGRIVPDKRLIEESPHVDGGRERDGTEVVRRTAKQFDEAVARGLGGLDEIGEGGH